MPYIGGTTTQALFDDCENIMTHVFHVQYQYRAFQLSVRLLLLSSILATLFHCYAARAQTRVFHGTTLHTPLASTATILALLNRHPLRQQKGFRQVLPDNNVFIVPFEQWAA